MADFWKENKVGIVLALLLIIGGVAYYFGAGLGKMGPAEVPKDTIDALRNAQIKVAVADETTIKLFALSPNNALTKLRADKGAALPEENSIVIGSEEARMMQEEKLFENPGDKLENFFGINTTVGGVLQPTGTLVDDLHFVSAEQFRQLDARSGRAFIKFTPEGVPKLFYARAEGEKLPVPVTFAEGDDSYESHTIAGTTYYPLIIGAKEAAMMREEKLFSKPGDFIKGFFGKDVVVVGVLAPTNTSLDMMHITPLRENELA